MHTRVIHLFAWAALAAACGGSTAYLDSNKASALAAGAEAVFHIEPNGAAFSPLEFYRYNVDSADDVPKIVGEGAGAGKL